MATLIQFSRNIRKRGSRIENNSVALTKRVAKRALKRLVNGTPVDKGVARSNWRVSLGNPTRRVVEAHSPGKKLGFGERSNARAALALGNIKINSLRAGPSRRGAGSALFITNSIPYLDKLRSGSSTQQPTDWVTLALIEAKAEIRGTRLLRRGVN